MRNIFKLLVVLLAVMPYSAKAQFSGFNLKSNNQIFIEEALQGAFPILEQSYQLKDAKKNEILGRGGKDYFSKLSFLAIRTNYGLIIHQDAVHPWAKDDDFVKYENQYEPILFRSSLICPGKENKSTVINDTIGEKKVSSLKNTPFVVYRDSLFLDGLECDTLSGKKEGWMVWFTADGDLNPSSKISLMSYKKDIHINKEDESLVVATPETSKQILGGIYICPVATRVGQITFRLVGIANKNGNNWILHCPFFSLQQQKTEELTIINNGMNKLNPKKHKKK